MTKAELLELIEAYAEATSSVDMFNETGFGKTEGLRVERHYARTRQALLDALDKIEGLS